jgi:DNA-binding MarR family transcriptional regulator
MKDNDIEACIQKITELMPAFAKGLGSAGPIGMTCGAITMPQIAVMHCIVNNPCCKMSDIRDAFNIKLSSATGMVDRLENENYVARKKDPKDNRVVRLRLTAKGKNILSKMMTKKREHIAFILEKLSKDERKCFVGIMEKIAVSIRSEKGDIKK